MLFDIFLFHLFSLIITHHWSFKNLLTERRQELALNHNLVKNVFFFQFNSISSFHWIWWKKKRQKLWFLFSGKSLSWFCEDDKWVVNTLIIDKFQFFLYYYYYLAFAFAMNKKVFLNLFFKSHWRASNCATFKLLITCFNNKCCYSSDR